MKKLLICLFIVLLIGCNKLDSGIVIEKTFVPKHTQTYIAYIQVGNTRTATPRTRRVPDRWYITIEGVHNNKTKREKYSIAESNYEKINIGDFVSRRSLEE